MADAGYPIERMKELVSSIRKVHDKKTLAGALTRELGSLSIYDLQRISAAMEREINQLPSPYRERVRPSMREQFFGRYLNIIGMNGHAGKISGTIRDVEQFEGYCGMMARMGDDPRTWESVKELPEFTGYYH